jgi:hypothetical protein
MSDTRLLPTPTVAAPDLRKRSGDWELLLREGYHRMKNTLAFMASSRFGFSRIG